jgi:Tfp pilus assembly protein PilF
MNSGPVRQQIRRQQPFAGAFTEVNVMLPCVRLIGIAFAFTGIWGMPRAVASDAPAVALNCKIVSDRGEPRHAVWLVELRDAAGRPLRQALRMIGDTVHFKDLAPGIYRIYLWGRGGRRSSLSVDLHPTPGVKSPAFAKVIHVPKTASPGQFRVDITTLAIPKEALGEMHAAEKAALSGDEDGLVHHLIRALDLDPGYADAWNNMGAYHYRKGEYAESMREFGKVTELEPESYLGWMNLGASLLANHKFAEAVDAGRKALELNPGDAIANSQLGLGYFYLHNFAKAKKYLRRARDLDPVMVEAPQLLLAQISLREKDIGQAIAYLKEYLGYHPNSPQDDWVTRTMASLAGEADRVPDRVRR